MHYSLIEQMRLSFINSDLFYRGAIEGRFDFTCTRSFYYSQTCLKWPPLLNNNLYYVILILISLHSAFHIN
jgi:hypothetical protein